MRKVIASILVALYVMVFLPVTVLLGFYRVFFDSSFYKGEFVELAYDLVADEFPRVIAESDNPPPISETELRAIVKDVFTEDDFSSLIDDFVVQLDRNLATDEGVVTLTLNLEWFRNKDSMVVEKVADVIIADLEPCAPGLYDPTVDFPDCIPSELPLFDFENRVMIALDREFFGDLPNEISSDLSVPSGYKGSISDFLNDSIGVLFLVGALSLLSLLVFIGLLIFSPAVRAFRWIFKTILAGATLVLIIALVLFFSPQVFVFPPEFNLYGEIASFLSVTLAKELLVFVVPIFLFSLLLWIVTMVKDKDSLSHDS